MKTKITSCIFSLFLITFVSCNKSTNESKKQNNTEDQDIMQKSTSSDLSVSGTYEINNNSSIILWEGSKPAGSHNGVIKIKSGEMKFDNGEMTAAKFIADMTSIDVQDLEGEEKKDLENHLKGKISGKEDHFFNVEKYPESQFTLKSVSVNEDNYIIYGELTIKGKSNPVELDAMIEFGNDNKSVKLISEEFEIDRTKWGIEYMSKSVFDDLKERFIDDEIVLKVELKASKV